MPGKIRHGDVAVLDAHAVGETAIGLEQIGIALIAAEAEAGGDVERHLVAAMRDAAARRPAMGLQHRQRALIFAEPVGQRAVELQPVAIRPHAAVADQVARILVAEQVLAGRHRRRIEFGERRLQRVSRGDRRPPRTRTADSRAAFWRRRSRSPDRSGRWRRPRAARRLPISFSTASMRSRSSAIGAPPIFILTTL